MFRLVRYSGPVLLDTALDSILGIPWLKAPHGSILARPGSPLDDDVTFAIATSTDDLSDASDKVPKAVLRSVFFAANLGEMVDAPEKVELLRRKAYEYNFWQQPGRGPQ